jgi:protein LTV1
MVQKAKPFIDKRRATTFDLVYRSAGDADDTPERVLAEAGGRPTPALGADDGPAGGHPLSWIASPPDDDIPAPRRQELLELGFADDGYDYARHLRTLGRGAASLEGLRVDGAGPSGAAAAAAAAAAAGRAEAAAALLGAAPLSANAAAAQVAPTSFFAAPARRAPDEDAALIDASALTLLQAAAGEADAGAAMGGVTAFSRRARVEDARAAARRELAELAAAMAEAEDEEFDIASDEEGRGAPAGDLEDDFILAAAGVNAAADVAAGAESGSDASESDGDDDDSWTSSDEGGGGAGAAPGGGSSAGRSTGSRRAGGPGSIASTYWREAREDRRPALDAIDERFEALALQYDDEELGGMEELVDAGEVGGGGDVADFDAIMDEFLQSRGQGGAGGGTAGSADSAGGAGADGAGAGKRGVGMSGAARAASALARELAAHGFSDADGGAAAEAAKAALRRFQARADAAEAAGRGWDGEDEDAGGGALPAPFAPRADRWDCESVLSLKSNIYNHPATLTEPPRAARAGVIALDRRGFPAGALLPRRGRPARVDEGGSGEEGESAGDEETVAARPAPPPTDRPKDESAEEKRARKGAVKEARRAARASKKELKTAFKGAAGRAARVAATALPQPAVHF